MVLAASTAMAAGDLHIYNWGDYTNPELIKKFEKQFDVKVTLDDYDSNETMLSKVRAGNSGYDIVVPSDYTVKIMIDEGLLEKTEPSQMENFKHVRPEFVGIYWDSGRHYSVPWQFGTTNFTVNTDKYKGDINTFAILFNPPDELKGQINILESAHGRKSTQLAEQRRPAKLGLIAKMPADHAIPQRRQAAGHGQPPGA